MPLPQNVDVDLFRAVAADAALIAGRSQKARLGTNIGIENKGGASTTNPRASWPRKRRVFARNRLKS